MLSYDNRFHGHGSLRYALTKGQSYRSSLFTLKTTSNRFRKKSRVAVVVSKKVCKTATGRNRIRRRIYEIIRHELSAIEGVHDIVLIVATADARSMSTLELYRSIREQLVKSGLYKKSPKSDTII